MNIVHAWANFVRVVKLFKRFEQLHVGARCFNGDHVGIQCRNRFDDLVEFAVTHMGVNLRFRTRATRRNLKRLHCPI
ncbi:Uncharacterised protein [Vibrio cholerae]|uniref:Uncharacterized protein n=1 Tax=Vibrio cholerae TaxID=666 RepID=A0A656ATK7_VIBCL|nr:Uncharacterised protein [Vibrio cholerae]CSC15865.1 Uncharacterised protein [Vibrio cholerae]CSD35005.1 Uncharacterised protein [Vibrio cholerae]